MVGILLNGRNFAVRIGHKLLEHIVEGLGLLGAAIPRRTLPPLVEAAAVIALGTVTPVTAFGAVSPILTGLARRGLRGLFNGQVDFSGGVNGNDLDLDLLANG
jgi:hypothetical protein